jgi:hypothetical protein
MKKKILQIYYLINLIFIQSNVLKVILGQDIPFVHPNLWLDPLHRCHLDYVFVSCHYIGSYVIYIIKRWGDLLNYVWLVNTLSKHTLMGWYLEFCAYYSMDPKVKGSKPSHTYWLPQWALGLWLVWLMIGYKTRLPNNFDHWIGHILLLNSLDILIRF